MNKSKEMYRVANILLMSGIILLTVGYFLQTILLPIQDIDILSAEELLQLQKEVALNYPLGQGLMFLGGIGMMISIILYVYFVMLYLDNKIKSKRTKVENTIHFISVTENDAAAIVYLRERIWATTYRGIYPDSMIDDFDYAWHLDKELQRISNPEYAVYLITRDYLNIGYLTIRKKDKVILQSLYILEQYQHQGIGKLAFDFVNEYCKENDANFFVCQCIPENKNARLFYEKMGGKIIGEDLKNEESWMNSVVYRFELS